MVVALPARPSWRRAGTGRWPSICRATAAVTSPTSPTSSRGSTRACVGAVDALGRRARGDRGPRLGRHARVALRPPLPRPAGRGDRPQHARQPRVRPPRCPTCWPQAFPDRPPYIVQFQDRGPAEWFHARDPHAFVSGIFHGPATKRKEAFTPEVIDRFVEPFRAVGVDDAGHRVLPGHGRRLGGRGRPPRADRRPGAHDQRGRRPGAHPGHGRRDGGTGAEPRRKVVIEDCGHWTQQEQPGATNRALVDWLGSLPRWS